MSTASDGGRRATAAHRMMPALAVYATATSWDLLTDSPLVVAASGVAAVVYLVILLSAIRHLRMDGMCVRCMENMPMDPQRAVRRWSLALRVPHCSRRTVWVAFVVAFGLNVVGWFLPPGSVGYVATGVPNLLLGCVGGVALWQHHRLQPWCPWCRGWGDGGEPEVVPDPTPGEVNTR